MEKILITGVAGFIGSHVARRFQREGYRVVGVDDLSGGELANVPEGIEFIRGDLTLASTMASLPSDCRRILHLAGQSSGEISFDEPVVDLNKNTVSTLNLIRYGIEHRVERLVYASSMSIYGSVPSVPIEESRPGAPLSCYGVGKLAAENYLKVYASRLPFVAMRMFNVYGPGQNLKNLRQGMVSIYLAQALTGTGSIEVKGSTERFRDFIYIDDVVEAWWRAATRDAALGQTFNIGTGIKTTVGDLLQHICALTPGSSFFVRGSTPGDQSGIYADVTKLREVLGISSSTPLDIGLRHFVDWARQASRPGQ
ncbi:NAD-dependent epimerase/dehydratase family protein [Steroidobacter flavus]|uniref:NAD-dependent epimerase/dehydratase family protein n=1 Tax=Steroidobacter flavus TaxID=1842136 RepID=A0ABV8T2K2_9GAMM